MNLRQTIAKQQENWIKRCDGFEHSEMDCQFCNYHDKWYGAGGCDGCPVLVVLSSRCSGLVSLNEWWRAKSVRARAAAARLVLADVNRIARHYHYPVREP